MWSALAGGWPGQGGQGWAGAGRQADGFCAGSEGGVRIGAADRNRFLDLLISCNKQLAVRGQSTLFGARYFQLGDNGTVLSFKRKLQIEKKNCFNFVQ